MPVALRFQSTLPQGERLYSNKNTTAFSVFQSTLPQGERQNMLTKRSIKKAFQSTLPQGERLYCDTDSVKYIDFNPRSHKGSDLCKLLKHNGVMWISIHAPTRGATNLFTFPVPKLKAFQSTLPQGERQRAVYGIIINVRFQSTLPQGERPGFSSGAN